MGILSFGLYNPDRKATILDNIAGRGILSKVVFCGRVITADVSAANPAMEPEINLLRMHVNFSSVTLCSIVVTNNLITCNIRISRVVVENHIKKS